MRGMQMGRNAAALNTKRGEQADDYAARLRPVLIELQAEGITSVRRTAEALNERGVPTITGGQWHPTTVQRVLERLNSQVAQ
ncbi:recombinase family protein [Methylobacterium oxalidis]